jgi:hypothetical protein
MVLGALAALLTWAFIEGRQELERERERERPIKVPPRVSRDPSGETIVTIGSEVQARIALSVVPLKESTHRPETVAFGELEEDPSRTFVLRAPFAGVVREGSKPWPVLGRTLEDRAVVGMLEPRLTPVERLDVETKLSVARGEVAAVAAVASASRAAAQRSKALHERANYSTGEEVEQSEAKAAADEARLKAAQEAVHLGEVIAARTSGAVTLAPLSVERGGEVVESLVRPGEAVEAGQPMLRVTSYDELFARVELPAGEILPEPVSSARVVVLGREDDPLRAERVALTRLDPRTRGVAVLFRVKQDNFPLRPGAAVVAYLPRTEAPLTGVTLPRSAVVRFLGKAWVYCQLSADRFARREIPATQPTDDGWFVPSGVKAGERVVATGAQLLLSEELKSQIQVGDEAEQKQ